jgi:hypothetical protein
MSNTGRYRARAAECVRVAQQISNPQSKGSLLDMARAWLALVTQGEKNNDAVMLVYETPEAPQHAAQQLPRLDDKKE